MIKKVIRPTLFITHSHCFSIGNGGLALSLQWMAHESGIYSYM